MRCLTSSALPTRSPGTRWPASWHAGYQLAPSATDSFDDDDGNIHEDAINALAASGITEGCAEGSYCPRSGVERDQMASFLGRAEGLTAVGQPMRRIAWQLYRADGSCSLMVNGKELSEASCLFGGLSWSPDGERLVFPLGDDLWLIDRTGHNLTQLTSQPGFEGFPDWSPDGSRHRLHALGRRRRPRRSLSGGRRRRQRDAAPCEHPGREPSACPIGHRTGALLAVNGLHMPSGEVGIVIVALPQAALTESCDGRE